MIKFCGLVCRETLCLGFPYARHKLHQKSPISIAPYHCSMIPRGQDAWMQITNIKKPPSNDSQINCSSEKGRCCPNLWTNLIPKISPYYHHQALVRISEEVVTPRLLPLSRLTEVRSIRGALRRKKFKDIVHRKKKETT